MAVLVAVRRASLAAAAGAAREGEWSMNWSCFGMMPMLIYFCGVAFCWTAGVGHGGGCLETTGRRNLRRSCGGCDLSVSKSWRSGWGVGGLVCRWDALGEVCFPGGTGPWRV